MRATFLTLAMLLCTAAQAQDRPDLYAATHLVSGRETATRADGLTAGLRDVLVKLSGDPGLLDDPKLAAVDAGALLEDYVYLDRMSDLPHHDEQGTRDRPYFLRMAFAQPRIDGLLASLGEIKWPTARPRLQIRVQVTDQSGVRYPMTADGDDDERHRQALVAAADRFGMRLALRPEKALADPDVPDAMTIDGDISWSDKDFGWVGAWHTAYHANNIRWGIKGVSFDAAYRNLVLGAMAIASGHTVPGRLSP